MRHVQIIAEAYRIAMNKNIEAMIPFTPEEFQSMKQMHSYLTAVNALPPTIRTWKGRELDRITKLVLQEDAEQTFTGSPTLGDNEL